MKKESTNNRALLPTKYVRIGEEFERAGERLVCIRRPEVNVPADACKGCWFAKQRGHKYTVNCNEMQCSVWDRMDGNNVWFVAKDSIFDK